MNESIIYREYVSSDFDSYKQLYKAVFSKEMSAEHFNWKFKSEDMNAIIFCAVNEKGDLIGSRVVMITKITVGAKTYKAAQSVDSMVHPDFQGQGIYKQLNLHAIEALKQKDISMIMTFPNHNSLPPLEKLGWKKIAPISVYAKVLRYESLAGSKKFLKIPLRTIDKLLSMKRKKFTYKMDTVDTFNQHQKEFIKHALKNKIHQNRSEAFLEWKYTQKPDANYVKVVLSKEEAIHGICVIRMDNHPTKTSGVITEFIVADDQKKQELLENLLSYCRKELEIDILKLWEVEDLELSVSLKKSHFIKKPSSVWFSIKYLQGLEESEEYINDASHWYIAWGDADTA
ncbi:GNAT family N-acetyltransferase [Alkalihalobacillus sp. R86527]|uniref:GNAT family N-acetyltransferase n=1 Tax=Alkalihalobacillus sp. R86527 TaxID=3093863 RepID=UPI00366DF782